MPRAPSRRKRKRKREERREKKEREREKVGGGRASDRENDLWRMSGEMRTEKRER